MGPLRFRPFVVVKGGNGRQRSVSVSVTRDAPRDAHVRTLKRRMDELEHLGTQPMGLEGEEEEEGEGEEGGCEWAAAVVRQALGTLCEEAGVGEGEEEAEGGAEARAVQVRDSGMVRRYGYDASTMAALVQGSRRRHIWHLCCLVLPDPVRETVRAKARLGRGSVHL
jgi:hypothetical protein